MAKTESKKSTLYYVIELSDDTLKAVACVFDASGFPSVKAGRCLKIDPQAQDKELESVFQEALSSIGYKHEPLIIAVPRSKVTCRTLKVPAKEAREISQIVSLQAARYLPYPADELITGYEVLGVSSDGYSEVSIIVAHRDVINRCLKAVEALRPASVSVYLNTLGLVGLAAKFPKISNQKYMVIESDFSGCEAALFSQKKLLHSRSFRLPPMTTGWQEAFVAEALRTIEAFKKETSGAVLDKIYICGNTRVSECISSLRKNCPVTIEELVISGEKSREADPSFAGLIGLGLIHPHDSLSLLPAALKQKIARQLRLREIKVIVFLLGISLLLLFAGVYRNIDNKSRYLVRLRSELKRLEKEARPLEGIEKRFKFIEGSGERSGSSLEVLRELHQICPDSLKFSQVSYEAAAVTLEGQAPELDTVLKFVEALEKSKIFNGYEIKIRYATARPVRAGVAVEFEISCTAKNAKSPK